jgi:hypothetical protein
MKIELIYSLVNKDGRPCLGHKTRCSVLADAFVDVVPDIKITNAFVSYAQGEHGVYELRDGDYADTLITIIDEPKREFVPNKHYGKHVVVRVVDDPESFEYVLESAYYLYPIPYSVAHRSARSFSYAIINEPYQKLPINILLVPGSNQEEFYNQVTSVLANMLNDEFRITVNIAIGESKESYKELLRDADIVIASCSNNILEAISIKKPALFVKTSSDQEMLASVLGSRGVGEFSEQNFIKITNFVKQFYLNYGIKDESRDFVKDLINRCNL